ncbi:type IX secretion system membrane protein PorP/SprF [Tamlana sp. s12]|uniref:PorP/SprF family type IX secretion system membrane protein n=1 Tax=Tamlana sp. s12 TaxID=1630406 RepID=UPI0007FDF723|nr:type IX secretion system membrane protein PorP/SprF [Tamlana sp. s12]OBQ54179.1 membrane protein [Tamlana sp. s12]QQY81300.1 type IX secretion system membrane protein PorP/SprF [Tamlana sp. s12]
MKKIHLTLTFALLVLLGVNAQQDPQYTQYMYNMNVINPAYAGSRGDLAIGLLHRSQWVGIEGAPKTSTFSIHSPTGKNVGLGLSVVSDQIGPIEENNVYADFSYTLNLGGEHRLALGLKGGASFQNIGLFNDIGNGYVVDANDEAFSENTNNTYLNIGTGIFYYTDNYYVSFSIPNMLKNTYLDVSNNGDTYKFGSDVVHYFLSAGYVFNLSENTKFKPSFLLKSAFNAPTSLDVSANFLFFERFEAGATYRLDDSVGAMVNFEILSGLRVGYAYDYTTSELNVESSGSHEIMLLFDLNFPKKVSVSPRFF